MTSLVGHGCAVLFPGHGVCPEQHGAWARAEVSCGADRLAEQAGLMEPTGL